MGLVGRDRGSVAYLTMKERMHPGDTGLLMGEALRLFPSPNQGDGVNKDGRRDDSADSYSGSSGRFVAFGPTKDVSSRIRWGEGDLLAEALLDEMEESRLSRLGKKKGSAMGFPPAPPDPFRSRG